MIFPVLPSSPSREWGTWGERCLLSRAACVLSWCGPTIWNPCSAFSLSRNFLKTFSMCGLQNLFHRNKPLKSNFLWTFWSTCLYFLVDLCLGTCVRSPLDQLKLGLWQEQARDISRFFSRGCKSRPSPSCAPILLQPSWTELAGESSQRDSRALYSVVSAKASAEQERSYYRVNLGKKQNTWYLYVLIYLLSGSLVMCSSIAHLFQVMHWLYSLRIIYTICI